MQNDKKYTLLKSIDSNYIEKIASGYTPTLNDYEMIFMKLVNKQHEGTTLHCVMPPILMYIEDADIKELKPPRIDFTE